MFWRKGCGTTLAHRRSITLLALRVRQLVCVIDRHTSGIKSNPVPQSGIYAGVVVFVSFQARWRAVTTGVAATPESSSARGAVRRITALPIARSLPFPFGRPRVLICGLGAHEGQKALRHIPLPPCACCVSGASPRASCGLRGPWVVLFPKRFSHHTPHPFQRPLTLGTLLQREHWKRGGHKAACKQHEAPASGAATPPARSTVLDSACSCGWTRNVGLISLRRVVLCECSC